MISDKDFISLKKEVAANRLGNGLGYKLTRSAAGTTLNIKPGKGGGSSEKSHPFKAITSIPYTGEGDAPSDQALKFKVTAGIVIGPDGNVKFASNRNEVFTADDDISDGYFCWLKLGFMTNDDETVTFSTCEYDHGVTLPEPEEPDAETGAVPTNLYIPLFYVTTADGVIDGNVQLIRSSLQVNVEIQTISCDSNTRFLTVYGI